MNKSKKMIRVNTTLSPEIHEKAKEISIQIFGKVNVSGLYAFFIKNYKPFAGGDSK